MILKVCGPLCFSRYLPLSRASFCSDMASFVTLFGHVACFGFVRSIGPAIMFPGSSSPELQLLSSSRRTDLACGDIGGESSCLSRLVFSGGASCFGAGGGGALLLLCSSLVSAIAISSSLRCACRSCSCPSCPLSRSSACFSCPHEVPEVSCQFFSCLVEFFVQFFNSDVFLLFFVLFPLLRLFFL